jgi:hypothetical protein
MFHLSSFIFLLSYYFLSFDVRLGDEEASAAEALQAGIDRGDVSRLRQHFAAVHDMYEEKGSDTLACLQLVWQCPEECSAEVFGEMNCAPSMRLHGLEMALEKVGEGSCMWTPPPTGSDVDILRATGTDGQD